MLLKQVMKFLSHVYTPEVYQFAPEIGDWETTFHLGPGNFLFRGKMLNFGGCNKDLSDFIHSWQSKGTPPRNKALCSGTMKTHWFPLIRPAIRAGYFLGGMAVGSLGHDTSIWLNVETLRMPHFHMARGTNLPISIYN